MWKRSRKNNPGQSMMEYAVLLAVILLALAIMGVYVRNAVSGRSRDGADAVGQGEVYRPHTLAVPAANQTVVSVNATNI